MWYDGFSGTRKKANRNGASGAFLICAGLVLLGIVAAAVWLATRSESDSPQPDDGTNATQSSRTAQSSDVDSTATTSGNTSSQSDAASPDDDVTSSMLSTPVCIPAPGAEQENYAAPLADAYRRIDPTADGWQTEAFNEAAGKQLKKLAHLFEAPIDESVIKKLTDADFACTGLVPNDLRPVFEDKTIRVRRGGRQSTNPNDASAIESMTSNSASEGPQRLQEIVEQFWEHHGGTRPERIKLKLFRVEPNTTQATTTVYFQSVGPHNGSRLQINATWRISWSLVAHGLPKLLGIEVEDFEEVLCAARTTPMLDDCTASLLSDTEAYQRQFLRSTDHWRTRLARDLGLDVVANHGLALGDVNGDQLDDIYVCQQGGLPNRLLIQNPDGTLRDASHESGTDWLDYCASALIVDFDNDGDRDLVVAQEWRVLFMSNDGTGRFQLEFGTSSEAQSFSISASDFDLDGDVDLYICGYNPTASTVRRGAMGEPVPYHDANNGGRNVLFRNDGNWLFTDVTNQVGLDQNNSRFSFAAAWEDYDDDGDPDLYVANDYGRNNLYRNEGGRFVDVAPTLGVEDMSAGMSACWADVNRDGRMDLYVSNMFSAAGNRITYQRQFKSSANSDIREQFQRHARGNTLFLNTGDGFRDVSVAAGVTMGRWAWGSRFADLNGDGWEDLIVANGFISTEDTGDL